MNPRLSGLVSLLLRFTANSVPQQNNLILFGARKGNWYADCSRQVYEKTLRTRPDLRPVWMTRNKEVHQRLKQEGKPVCHMNSPMSFYLLSKARLAVISTQLYDVTRHPSMIPDSLRFVFLGHGKSVKASTLAFKSGRSQGFRRMFERAERLTEAAVSTSPFVAKLSAAANGFPEHKFHITGYPRNDLLIHPEDETRKRWQEYTRGLKPRLTLLYAPTWRQRGDRTRFFPFADLDEGRLFEYLSETRTLLLLRPHERDLLNHEDLQRFLARLEQASEWIRICDQRSFQNVNNVLPFMDGLITDYSSISNDYLLLDRPMIFIPYDYEEFERVQGFMYDYYATLPGPSVESQDGFLRALEDVHAGIDTHRSKRRRLAKMIHTHLDGKATERVVGLIDQRLRLNGSSGLETPVRRRVEVAPLKANP